MKTLARAAVVALVVSSACSKDAAPTSTATTSITPSTTTTASTTDALPQGSEPVQLDPSDFVATIDNPYWPMKPGTRWVYEEIEEGETQRVEVTVTEQTRTILGVGTTVVHDVVTLDGSVIEDTFDWYAQDKAGNI
jgi:hypothetical protein